MRVLGRQILLLVALLFLSACRHFFPDHHLVHPRELPAGVVTWSDSIEKDELRIRLEGARPAGAGPFPVVLVHPEAGRTAAEMRGVVWDLAKRGYLAVAADYERLIKGRYRRSLFSWRSKSDPVALLEAVSRNAFADPGRVGLLGFSQGGVFSLIIAAQAAERIDAVVAYYPLTDFEHWLRRDQPGFLRRRIVWAIRRYFWRQSGTSSEEEFQAALRRASPYHYAEEIEAPVLLIHGARDTTAPPEQSQRMADRLAAAGGNVRLLVVPDAVHIFNFRQRTQAAEAWGATVEWLDSHLMLMPREEAGEGKTDA
ncbi:MAG TPA: prolyl oligopeptidase family serine peptidase [Opitutaceae bacterium]